MRFCLHCQRLNPGHPVFCQFCGHSFEFRICRGCRHLNPPEVLACRQCGGRDFSEPAGLPPLWMVALKWSCWILLILLLVGLVKFLFLNFELVASFVVILGFFYLAYSFLPEPGQGLVKRMLKAMKDLVFNKSDNNIQNGER